MSEFEEIVSRNWGQGELDGAFERECAEAFCSLPFAGLAAAVAGELMAAAG